MRRVILSILIVFSLILTACGNNTSSSKINSEEEKSKLEIIPDISTSETEVETEILESNTEQVKGDDTMISIKIQIGEKSFTAKLYNNPTTNSFIEQLPMTLDMSELNGNEKYNYLSVSLPTNTERIGLISTGDLMLYGSNCLVIFYQDFQTSYSYTRLGYLDNATGLASALGKRNVKVSFAINE